MSTAHQVLSLRPAHRAFLILMQLSLAASASFLMTKAHAQFPPDKQPVAWIAPLHFSTYNLDSGAAVAFRSDYIRATWDGDLVAYNVDRAGVFSVKWRAREQLPAHDSRIIFTSSTSGNGVPLRWAGITPAQQAMLGNATNGPKVLNYLRGDASNEISATKPYPTGIFRPRFSKLGAVVHSRPYFYDNKVYVGANDGMLHAFDATTGKEDWAYVPSMLFDGNRLTSLTSPFSTNFPYLVDGSMAIGTVGTRKMLVGSLGAGAKGLYALDITNPNPAPTSEAVAAAKAKWEIIETTPGYANLGYVMTAPQIAKLNDGNTVVLAANGLLGNGGTSALFVIRASDGFKLAEIPAGTPLSGGIANGLGAISPVDKDGNGTVDVVYAGDLKGTLWKFDLSSATYPSAATAVFTPSLPVEQRPITAAPSVSLHPRGELLINFGTGSAFDSADVSGTAAAYLYGVLDSGSSTSANLVTQTLTSHTVSGTMQVRTASNNLVSYSGTNRGWRIQLAGGERLIGGDLLTDSGRFTVTTTIPNPGSTQGAWLMQVNALTGGSPTVPFFDLNNDGKVRTNDATDRLPGGTPGADVPVGKFLGSGVWSQPVLAQVGTSSLDLPLFNFNPNQLLDVYTTKSTPTSGGVAGGHFDFDIFYGCNVSVPFTKSSCTNSHTHEYDDKFNVVGVNMLNASQTDYNLSMPIPSTTVPSFKILVSNTRWSPAALLKVGDTISGPAWQLPLSPEGFLAEVAGGPAKVFTRASLSNFVYVLPLNAFTNRDWGTGEVRGG